MCPSRLRIIEHHSASGDQCLEHDIARRTRGEVHDGDTDDEGYAPYQQAVRWWWLSCSGQRAG